MSYARFKPSANVRRILAVAGWYIVAFLASHLLNHFVAPSLSRLLYRWGITRSYIGAPEISHVTPEPGTLVGAIVATMLIMILLLAPLHLALAAGFLAAATRVRRRLFSMTLRCCRASCGWGFATAVAVIIMIGWITTPVAALCAYVALVVAASWQYTRAHYWNRAVRIHPMCNRCRYLLRGLPTSGQCPECGTPYGARPARGMFTRNRT